MQPDPTGYTKSKQNLYMKREMKNISKTCKACLTSDIHDRQ